MTRSLGQTLLRDVWKLRLFQKAVDKFSLMLNLRKSLLVLSQRYVVGLGLGYQRSFVFPCMRFWGQSSENHNGIVLKPVVHRQKDETNYRAAQLCCGYRLKKQSLVVTSKLMVKVSCINQKASQGLLPFTQNYVTNWKGYSKVGGGGVESGQLRSTSGIPKILQRWFSRKIQI